MKRPKYIAIEGPIGAGKSSLANILGARLKAKLILDQQNPFLENFYSDMEKYAFQTQLYFLLARFGQQKDLMQQDLFQSSVVCDYLFLKDRIFASITLDENEFILYEKVYSLLKASIPLPDLVIYLQTDAESLEERLRGKKNPLSERISLDYLRELVKAYNYFFFHYNQTPLLVVNTKKLDFVNNPEDMERLIKEINQLKSGTNYFVPF
jgi:deoxyadenosine/deoxycytidine kinase